MTVSESVSLRERRLAFEQRRSTEMLKALGLVQPTCFCGCLAGALVVRGDVVAPLCTSHVVAAVEAVVA
jgi:hypothetical protein